MSDSTKTDLVRDRYASVATGQLTNDSEAVRSVAMAFGYSAEELETLPSLANMGLSCGNPLALAGVREGEVVLDLGCGGGMDVFLAAQKVGAHGKAIGVDMTEEMLSRARAGAEQLGLSNVEFHHATIDQLPLPDNSVDCVISNCVINLVDDKAAVFREILRVLKPGGRLAVSDIALKKPLPDAIKQSLEAYVGCISGAIMIEDYKHQIAAAGFDSIAVNDTGADLNAYTQVADGSGCCGTSTSCCSDNLVNASTVNVAEPSLHGGLANVMQTFDVNEYAASVQVYALKMGGAQSPVAAIANQSTTRKVRIYDRAMCCSTGVCGADVDPVLPRFAADLDWLKSQGHDVVRYNLAQDPAEYVKNSAVQQMLAEEGIECLPIVMVEEIVVSRGDYPSRNNLAMWTGTALKQAPVTKPALPMADGGCCGSTGCC